MSSSSSTTELARSLIGCAAKTKGRTPN
jgi:hypothetical protein